MLALSALSAPLSFAPSAVTFVAAYVATNGDATGTLTTISRADGLAREAAIAASSDGLFFAAWSDIRAAHPNDADVYALVLQETAGAGCANGLPGDIAPMPNGDGRVDVGDVVIALRASVGLETLTGDALVRGDVAPGTRSGNVHSVTGDGVIDIGDVVVLLDASVGQITIVN